MSDDPKREDDDAAAQVEDLDVTEEAADDVKGGSIPIIQKLDSKLAP